MNNTIKWEVTLPNSVDISRQLEEMFCLRKFDELFDYGAASQTTVLLALLAICRKNLKSLISATNKHQKYFTTARTYKSVKKGCQCSLQM
jgi:hypothetical protein